MFWCSNPLTTPKSRGQEFAIPPNLAYLVCIVLSGSWEQRKCARTCIVLNTHVFVYLVYLCTCGVCNRRFEYSKEVFMQYIRYICVWPIWSAHCTVLSDGSRVHGSAQLRGREWNCGNPKPAPRVVSGRLSYTSILLCTGCTPENRFPTKIECYGVKFSHEHDLRVLDPA